MTMTKLSLGLLLVSVGVVACPPSEPPFCECRGVAYRAYQCVPPPGLPKECYEHHDDEHASRVW